MDPLDTSCVVEVARRDTKEKQILDFEGIVSHVENLLNEMQASIFKNALDFRNNSTVEVEDFESFKKALKNGGFISAHV